MMELIAVSVTNVKDHIRVPDPRADISSQHDKTTQQACPHCGKIYSNPGNLRTHIKNQHGNGKVDAPTVMPNR